MHIRYQVLTFSLVVAVALVVIFKGSSTPENTDDVPDKESVEIAAADVSIEAVAESPISTVSSTGVGEASPPSTADPTIQEWSVYDVVFGTNDESSPLSRIHAEFKNQDRDESWASAMEAGIRGSIRFVDENRITVDSVECRTTICEVAGFMPDRMKHPQPDPRDILVDDFGAGWWHGDFSVALREHTYAEEEITRFLIIIANRGVMEKWMMPDRDAELSNR